LHPVVYSRILEYTYDARTLNRKFPNNTSKWQMGFNSVFKGLIPDRNVCCTVPCTEFLWSYDLCRSVTVQNYVVQRTPIAFCELTTQATNSIQ
jgi:hypothetical protein